MAPHLADHVGGDAGGAGEEHAAGADVPGEDQVAASAEGEEQLGRGEGAVVLAQPQHVHAPELGGKRQILVGVDDPLRLAGGAAGVVERTRVVAVGALGFQLGALSGDQRGVTLRSFRRLRADHEHMLQVGQLGPQRLHGGQQRLVDEQRAGATVAQHVGVVGGLEHCVQANMDRADLQRAEERGHPLGGVWRKHSDVLAEAHPKAAQRVAHLVHLVRHLAEVKRALVADQGRLVGPRRQVALQDLYGVVVKREISPSEHWSPPYPDPVTR